MVFQVAARADRRALASVVVSPIGQCKVPTQADAITMTLHSYAAWIDAEHSSKSRLAAALGATG
jgi:hypothetical protein